MNKSAHPSAEQQQRFWDAWNVRFRGEQRPVDAFMRRQSEIVLEWLGRSAISPSRILEVGCGTGWLAAQLQRFGEVTAIDLAPESIEIAMRRYPCVTFLAGDFVEMPIRGPFQFVTSVDVIAHVPDQHRFVGKIATLLQPGGLFVLLTQNPFVWNRSSNLAPRGEGQIRRWPSLRELRALLDPGFRLLHASSIEPAGDLGVLRYVNSYKLTTLLRRMLGEARVKALYEREFIGRELVIVAERV